MGFDKHSSPAIGLLVGCGLNSEARSCLLFVGLLGRATGAKIVGFRPRSDCSVHRRLATRPRKDWNDMLIARGGKSALTR